MPTKKKVDQSVNKDDETLKAAKAPAKKKAPAVKPAPASEDPAEVKANIKENAEETVPTVTVVPKRKFFLWHRKRPRLLRRAVWRKL